jgi:hypothetical protein
LGRLLLAIPLSVALMMAVETAPARAITRDEVLSRANTWVKKRVPYSQSGYYRGYRRDCSGMVSMAWGLRTSYTSSTIRSRARSVSKRDLKPGDAVQTPGHVSIFVGWANASRTRYRVMEQSGSGKPALRRTRTWRRNAKGLRFRGIRENPPLLVASNPIPVTPATPTVAVAAAAVTGAPTVPLASSALAQTVTTP